MIKGEMKFLSVILFSICWIVEFEEQENRRKERNERVETGSGK